MAHLCARYISLHLDEYQHDAVKLMTNLFVHMCVFSVLSNLWPGEDNTAGTVRQLQ